MKLPETSALPEPDSAGDAIPPGFERIEVHITELWQLFNAIDPSPFHERDLDASAEEFIVSWAREVPRHAPLALVVHLDRAPGDASEPALLRDAVQRFFQRGSESATRRLKRLFRVGRTSLAIGIAFLTVSIALGDAVARLSERPLADILRESLLIGGWVAMWRPLEIFLYDWWPIRDEAALYQRLAKMPVGIHYAFGEANDAWRHDWPAAPGGPRTVQSARSS